MTFERFKEIWGRHEFAFECSPRLMEALLKASDGNFEDMDEIDRKLDLWDKSRTVAASKNDL